GVARVQLSELGVVHAGVVTLVSPNDAGLAMTSLNSPNMFIGMMSTLSEASPACSVELKSPESAENGALGVDNPRGVLPMSGRLKTMMRCAPALRSRAICASVSVAAVVILACTWAALS